MLERMDSITIFLLPLSLHPFSALHIHKQLTFPSRVIHIKKLFVHHCSLLDRKKIFIKLGEISVNLTH